MKPIFYSLLITLITSQLFAQEYLRIGDVQNSWSTYDGSIENAKMLVTPKGLYAECQVYLDFSVKCTPFTNPSDSLEVQMGFRLPVDAEVIDLWLWINGVPVRAEVYDRWTASQIYESYVDRRTDPALLVKQSDTDYELHVFPMMVNMPRKIKMTFLLPLNKLTGDQAQVTLPLNIFKLSSCPIENIQMAVKAGQGLDHPSFLESSQQVFQWITDPVFGTCYSTDWTDLSQLTSLTLLLTDTDTTNYFAGFHAANSLNEGEYELELDLADILGLQASKKSLFLVDFIDQNSSLSRTHVINTLKNYISTWFSAGDSVNFMFSGFFTETFSSNWVSADSASLAQIFNTIDTTYISNASNLPLLLIDGMNFIQSHENKGNIVLIASSDEFIYVDESNELFEDVINFMGPQKIPINTINLDDMSWLNYYGNNLYYRGNEYLYSNLSTYSGGEFQTILSYNYLDYYYWYYESIYTSYETMLGSLFPKLTDYFTALDVYTTLSSGFTYSNYDLGAQSGFVYFGSPFRKTGKFYGTFPMEISISAVTSGGQFYNSQLSLDASELYALDSTTQNVWAAQYIRSMLGYTQSSSVVSEIIQASKNERVLCKYTAFLALEPNTTTVDTVFIPITVGSGGGGTGVEETVSTVVNHVTCYPNPATTVVMFDFNVDEASEVDIVVYNLYGERVATILNDQSVLGHQSIHYNVSDLASGIYFYRVTVNGKLTSTGKMIVAK
ncbi:MAG: T9SS type A sorting domain-containing protein [Chitinophagales bacterium]